MFLTNMMLTLKMHRLFHFFFIMAPNCTEQDLHLEMQMWYVFKIGAPPYYYESVSSGSEEEEEEEELSMTTESEEGEQEQELSRTPSLEY